MPTVSTSNEKAQKTPGVSSPSIMRAKRLTEINNKSLLWEVWDSSSAVTEDSRLPGRYTVSLRFRGPQCLQLIQFSTTYGLKDRGVGVPFQAGYETFLFIKMSTPTSETHPTSHRMYAERYSPPGVRRMGREADHLRHQAPSLDIQVGIRL